MDIQKLKDEAFAEALEELKEEYSGKIEVLEKLARYENEKFKFKSING